MEEWKDIQDYEGLYQVSSETTVKSLDRYVESSNRWGKYMKHLKEKPLRQTPDSDGYLTVNLWKNGVGEKKKVHVLVAQAFIPNPNNYEHVHHIDHNPLNNHVENLQWISKEEHFKLHESELRDAIREANSKTVYQFEGDEIVNVWKSATEAARVLGFDQSGISQCCNDKIKTYKSYIWSYSPLA